MCRGEVCETACCTSVSDKSGQVKVVMPNARVGGHKRCGAAAAEPSHGRRRFCGLVIDCRAWTSRLGGKATTHTAGSVSPTCHRDGVGCVDSPFLECIVRGVGRWLPPGECNSRRRTTIAFGSRDGSRRAEGWAVKHRSSCPPRLGDSLGSDCVVVVYSYSMLWRFWRDLTCLRGCSH